MLMTGYIIVNIRSCIFICQHIHIYPNRNLTLQLQQVSGSLRNMQMIDAIVTRGIVIISGSPDNLNKRNKRRRSIAIISNNTQ